MKGLLKSPDKLTANQATTARLRDVLQRAQSERLAGAGTPKNREMKKGLTMLLITKERFWEPTMSMKIKALTLIGHDVYENTWLSSVEQCQVGESVAARTARRSATLRFIMVLPSAADLANGSDAALSHLLGGTPLGMQSFPRRRESTAQVLGKTRRQGVDSRLRANDRVRGAQMTPVPSPQFVLTSVG